MSQRGPRGTPAMPGVGCTHVKAKSRGLPGIGKKKNCLSRTRQDLWEETSWSNQKWSRAALSPRRSKARSLACGKSEASPENAARERSRVKTLRQAFLALQAALPAVPPDTKLSKLDVLVLATSYIAHLTRTLGHELPGPAWSPFLRGLRYLHPLKKWPMRSRLYAGGLGYSDLDSTTVTTSGQRKRDAEVEPQVSGETDVLLTISPLSPALGGK
ncbi:PREDICTED: transcription factor 23 [Chrysochloris asiatica]|uniref:Transcription factor 23 n=1 Tax=Chrysochloris asiatica TaxID=185453 RepID=A0A9B0WIV4_CHRAS|nr:PREDICTED: transcription factor 23 [Chrysochloris asiatica]